MLTESDFFYYDSFMPIIFLRKKPFFTKDEFIRLATIFDNAGQIFLGVVVLSPLVSNLLLTAEVDTVNFSVIVLGLAATLYCWFLSMWLTRKAAQNL